MTDRTPEPEPDPEREPEHGTGTGTGPGSTAGGSTALTRLLLDVRVIIGGLFCVYGLIITIVGLFEAPSDIAKAEGVNINLWAGLAMLVVGSLFLLWAFLRPLQRGIPGP